MGLWIRIQPGAWPSVPCECCVFSGRSLCDGLIIDPEDSYLLCMCVCVSLSVIRYKGIPLIIKRVAEIFRIRKKRKASLANKLTRYQSNSICGVLCYSYVYFLIFNLLTNE
jgi:hypothetical protein